MWLSSGLKSCRKKNNETKENIDRPFLPLFISFAACLVQCSAKRCVFRACVYIFVFEKAEWRLVQPSTFKTIRRSVGRYRSPCCCQVREKTNFTTTNWRASHASIFSSSSSSFLWLQRLGRFLSWCNREGTKVIRYYPLFRRRRQLQKFSH